MHSEAIQSLLLSHSKGHFNPSPVLRTPSPSRGEGKKGMDCHEKLRFSRNDLKLVVSNLVIASESEAIQLFGRKISGRTLSHSANESEAIQLVEKSLSSAGFFGLISLRMTF